MRILHSIHSVNPAKGGVIEGLKQLAAVNQEAGHTVELVSLDPPEAPWVRDCPLVVHAMGPSRLKYGYSPRLVPWLRAHRHDFDMVVINGIWQYNSFGVWRALHGTDTPYFVFTHGMLDPWFKRQYPLKHLKKWLYWPWSEYRVLRDARAVLFTTAEERRLARGSFWLYRCREAVVNYGTAGPEGAAEEQRRLFLEKFPEAAGKRCLLFIGRIHEKKGIDVLIAALGDLVRERPREMDDVRLVVAGPNDNRYAREMARMAEARGLGGRIVWTGMLAGSLKWGAFYASEAFVLPSHQENFGVAVAEALACGVPVLISDKVNIWREVRREGAGLVDRDDAKGTRRMVERWILMSAEERERIQVRTRPCFDKWFHVKRTAGQFVRLLEQSQAEEP